jgi:CubicO group peptidase (beta-lactamase class C family)
MAGECPGGLGVNSGQLRWGERQLVPETWMKTATSRYVRDDKSSPSPYGYTFWIHDDWDGVPSDAFASHGFNGNDCYVVPSRELVVARLANQNPPREQLAKPILQRIVAALG